MSAYDDGVLAMFGADLVAYWPADDASGSLIDAKNAWDAAATGTSTYQAAGPTIDGVAQLAVQFSGTSYFTTSGSLDPASDTTGRSVFAWVYLPSTTAAVGRFLARDATNNGEMSLRHTSTGGAELAILGADGATLVSEAGGSDLDGGVWHLVIGWWDPADADARIQVDAETVVVGAGTAVINNDSTAVYGIGASSGGSGPLRSGSRMCKAGILDRVITAEERALLLSGVFTTPQIVKPDGDMTTTGWTTTPLWSKVDDDPAAPDGTTITATSA